MDSESYVSEESLAKHGIFDDIDDFFSSEFNPDLSIPFDTNLTGQRLTFKIGGGVLLTGTCNECLTSGSVDVRAKFRVELFGLKEAFVELYTDGLEAKAIIAMTMVGDLTDVLLQQSLPLFKASTVPCTS
jgi:hypothetical protein